jgi:2-polyprenyl-3-methyl-5-hydroxy-6-metoxy-1,4-benzoquinol methylase
MILKFTNRLFQILLKSNVLTKNIIYSALKLHNFSYQLAGVLSARLEPDRLHPKHRLMKYHQWFACHLDQGWNVLDVGCGNGALAFDICNYCQSVFAIDLNPLNIERAKIQFLNERITYLCGDATTYSFQQRYDAIILSNVLEHIENRPAFLIHLLANQDKSNPPILLLRVPMITRDWITLYKKEMGVEWRLDPTHHTEYTLQQLQSELNQASLKIDKYDVQFGEFFGVIRKI